LETEVEAKEKVTILLDRWDRARLKAVQAGLKDILEGSDDPTGDTVRFALLACYTLMAGGPVRIGVQPGSVTRTVPQPAGPMPWLGTLDPRPGLGGVETVGRTGTRTRGTGEKATEAGG